MIHAWGDGTEYGGATINRNFETGEVTVERADDRIGVDLDLLASDAIRDAHVRDGLLVLDTAGEYVYREVERNESVAVFERVPCPVPKPRDPAE